MDSLNDAVATSIDDNAADEQSGKSMCQLLIIRCISIDSLTRIRIPSQIKHIAALEFSGCSKLKSIELPSALEMIDGAAFYGCLELQDVYYTGSEEQWNQIQIEEDNNDALKNATIHFNSKMREPIEGPDNNQNDNIINTQPDDTQELCTCESVQNIERQKSIW